MKRLAFLFALDDRSDVYEMDRLLADNANGENTLLIEAIRRYTPRWITTISGAEIDAIIDGIAGEGRFAPDGTVRQAIEMAENHGRRIKEADTTPARFAAFVRYVLPEAKYRSPRVNAPDLEQRAEDRARAIIASPWPHFPLP
jgi:hypothetical protein